MVHFRFSIHYRIQYSKLMPNRNNKSKSLKARSNVIVNSSQVASDELSYDGSIAVQRRIDNFGIHIMLDLFLQ